jgi:predicted nucleotidyltransferase
VTAHPAVTAYGEQLVARLSEAVELEAVYLVGSGAYGDFVPDRSDVDVIAVVPRPLVDADKQALVIAAESIPCPGRKLELVVYAVGKAEYELNLNTGELVSFDPANDPSFWFVLDRAIAEAHAVPLLGPPWRDLFPPVDRDDVLAALRESLDWHEREEPHEANAVLNACRAWKWAEDGEWVSKPKAATWLRAQARAAVEAAS